MKGHYNKYLENEMDRLWLGRMNVLVIKIGNDKFMLSDGKRSVHGKGYEFMRILKRLPNKAGTDKFWRAVDRLNK